MNTRKRRILIFIDWFTPAYKAGGPIKSISNFVNHLSSDFNLFIVTSDRDLGDNHPYSNVKFNHWIQNDEYSIIYLSKDCQKATFYHSILKKIKPDICSLNKKDVPDENGNTKTAIESSGFKELERLYMDDYEPHNHQASNRLVILFPQYLGDNPEASQYA